MSVQCIALLGRKDVPTDAVEEYCRYLGEALQARGIQLDIRRVPWEIHGWKAALETVPLMAKQWRGQWVFVQYTALAWSARGFPQKVLRVIEALRVNSARVAVVFHDVEPYAGPRIVDRIRRRVQISVMRRLIGLSELAIFTVPVEAISWLDSRSGNVAFVPVGPNLPTPESVANFEKPAELPSIGVFSITGGAAGDVETQTILLAVRKAAQSVGRLKLNVFGRHAELREEQLRKGVEGLPVELSVEGVIDAPEVMERLGRCDVTLFVRGAISTRRSSAIAAIARGRPVIAYKGTETAGPIEKAGVVLIAPGDTAAIGDALTQVLTDERLRSELAARSRSAFERYFSWPAVAARYSELLGSK